MTVKTQWQLEVEGRAAAALEKVRSDLNNPVKQGTTTAYTTVGLPHMTRFADKIHSSIYVKVLRAVFPVNAVYTKYDGLGTNFTVYVNLDIVRGTSNVTKVTPARSTRTRAVKAAPRTQRRAS